MDKSSSYRGDLGEEYGKLVFCQDMLLPVTPPSLHSVCRPSLSKSFSAEVFSYSCRGDFGEEYSKPINSTVNIIYPGSTSQLSGWTLGVVGEGVNSNGRNFCNKCIVNLIEPSMVVRKPTELLLSGDIEENPGPSR